MIAVCNVTNCAVLAMEIIHREFFHLLFFRHIFHFSIKSGLNHLIPFPILNHTALWDAIQVSIFVVTKQV